MSEFLLDQPLLRKKMEESGKSMSNVKDMIDSSDKKEKEIGSILLFLPKSDTSFDPVLSSFCIVPHPVKDIDELPKIFEEVLKNNIEKHLYIGPFHYNDDTEEYQCCYYEISEEELWKDIEKFRENNNTYSTYFDELDYTIY